MSVSRRARGRRPARVGVLDFFCGCGGASYGFSKARRQGLDVRILGGVDIDAHACATYRRMVGAPSEQLDIAALARRPSMLSGLLDRWGWADHDRRILVGCAPCQGFAAHRKAVEGRDPRRSLFVDFCRLAMTLRPDAIFIENVPDLFAKRHWPYFTNGRSMLEAAGYVVRGRIYNLADFGLPQERFRAVVMAFRHPFRMPEPLFGHAQHRTVRQAIGHLPSLRPGEASDSDPMHVTSRHRPETIATLARIPRDGGNRPVGVGPKCLDRARAAHGGFTDVYGRLAWDRPAVTITARCRTPSCGRFVHPEQNRGLSIREAALLQGFPGDYMFEGPFDDRFKQIGNAVPPLVAKIMAEHVLGVISAGRDTGATVSDPRDIVRPVGPGFAVTINGIKRRRSTLLRDHAVA